MKAVILNSLSSDKVEKAEVVEALCDSLKKADISVKNVSLRDKKIKPCMACDGCLYLTPGKCVQKDDSGEVLGLSAESEIIILFTDIIFGGYSSQLKKIVDKFALLATPFYKVSQGRLLHPSRYEIQKYYIVVGFCGSDTGEEEVENLKLITKRNSINLSIPFQKCLVIKPCESSNGNSKAFANEAFRLSEEILEFIREGEISER